MRSVIIDGVKVLVEEADSYLQINDVCGTDLGRIWEHIKTDYRTYDKWICYHNTEVPLAALNEIDAVLEDNSVEMRVDIGKIVDPETPGIDQVTEDNFDDFAAYHDINNPDMFWTSERIRRDLSRWVIYTTRKNNRISGYVLMSLWDPIQAEIYCINASDRAQCDLLITCAVRYASESGKKEVLFMADENEIGYEAALSIGFAVTGFYRGYVVKRTSHPVVQ